MTDTYAAGRFDQAAALLPERLRLAALELCREQRARAEELRLRIGQPVQLTLPEGELPLSSERVEAQDLEQVLDRVTDYSRYTAAETLRQGYVTAPGGFRVGVCGTALPGEGENQGLRDLSSLAIRIPRVCEGIAAPLLPSLLENGRAVSTLVLSPPGGGKTTFLRDLVRLLSKREALYAPHRVALVDERGELAAVYRGQPQLEVGEHTDVLDGCPKALAVPMLLRAMNPQVIALDELALPGDVGAVLAAAGCGVALLATAHAASVEALARRPILRPLLESGVFRRAVVIEGRGVGRSYRVEVLS